MIESNEIDHIIRILESYFTGDMIAERVESGKFQG